MLPPRTIERLPDWARRPIAGQIAWKWAMLLASLASTLALILVAVRWSRRRARDARVGTLLRRLVAPLAMLVTTQLLRAFLDDQVQVTGMVTAWPDYLAELASGLALIWTILLLARWIPDALNAMPRSGTKHLDPSLVRWSARVVALLAILMLLFSAAQGLGIPVYGLVAGAGVGGLAVALAAPPTLENFIGALNLFADRPVRVGRSASVSPTRSTIRPKARPAQIGVEAAPSITADRRRQATANRRVVAVCDHSHRLTDSRQ